MRANQLARGVIVYEKEEADYRREDVERLASLQAQRLGVAA